MKKYKEVIDEYFGHDGGCDLADLIRNKVIACYRENIDIKEFFDISDEDFIDKYKDIIDKEENELHVVLNNDVTMRKTKLQLIRFRLKNLKAEIFGRWSPLDDSQTINEKFNGYVVRIDKIIKEIPND